MSRHLDGFREPRPCWPDCNHNHTHRATCEHGAPSAKPHGGKCRVCDGHLTDARYCPIHFLWECGRHALGIGSGHVLEVAR
jgi:hypothetical protein